MDSHVKNLLVSQFMAGLVAGFLLIALPLYLIEVGIDISSIGYVFGTATLFYAFLSFWLGSRSEHKGRLAVGIAATIGMAVSSMFFGMLALFPISLALVVFTISKILFDSSESVLWNIVKIRVLDLFHHKRFGRGFGVLSLSNSSGFGLGMLFGGMLLSSLPFKTIFLGMSMLLLVSLVFYKRTGDISVRPNAGKARVRSLLKTSKLFKAVLLLNTVLYAGGAFVGNFGLPLFQKEVLEMTTWQILVVTGIAWVVYSVFCRWGGRLYDLYGNRMFIASLVLLFVNSFVFILVKDILLFSVILVLDYIISGFVDPSRFALAGIVSRENKGTLMSLITMTPTVALGLIMLAFGEFVRLFSFESMFIFRAVVMASSAAILLYVDRLMGPVRHRKK